MEGVSIDWNSRIGYPIVQQHIDSLLLHFNWLHPKASLPGLLNLYQLLGTLPSTTIVNQKKRRT